MRDGVLGLVSIVVGVAFCARGYLAMRVIIPIWGAFTGFIVGAGIVAGVGDDDLLRSLGAWIVGIVVGVVFALCAYLWYEVSVAIGMAAIGFALGATLLVAVGVTWSWLVVLVAVICGAALAVVAIVGELPMLLLVVLTALAGSTAVVTGVMLLVGVIDTDDLDRASTTERIEDDWWWYALYLAVAATGMAVQLRHVNASRRVRDGWHDDRRRQLHA